MTNPKQSESDTEKNPWAMVNPNYKFGKSLLIDGDLKKVAPFTRMLHTFYMQRGKSYDDSQIMVALQPRTNAWPQRDESSNELQQLLVQLSDLNDLFNMDALDLTLLFASSCKLLKNLICLSLITSSIEMCLLPHIIFISMYFASLHFVFSY
jgi:hypothetical protein